MSSSLTPSAIAPVCGISGASVFVWATIPPFENSRKRMSFAVMQGSRARQRLLHWTETNRFLCRRGGTGRHFVLKIRWFDRAGSIPAADTMGDMDCGSIAQRTAGAYSKLILERLFIFCLEGSIPSSPKSRESPFFSWQSGTRRLTAGQTAFICLDSSVG